MYEYLQPVVSLEKAQGLCIYNSLCADMVMWISTLVGKIMLHKMHDSKLEVCPLSKDH